MRMRFGLVGAVAATAVVSALVVGASASAAPAAFPPCPTQSQLAHLGATAGEVSSPPQMSTGTFPVAAGLTVPDEQCSYQGTLLLLLVYWGLPPTQLAAAKAHFQFECRLKNKNCTVFLNRGSNTIVSSTPGGATKTKSEPTLAEVVIAGSLNGEATATNPPTSHARCDTLAQALFGFLAAGGPAGKETASLRQDFSCP
jgi:hypothetical protein